jgi:hypothetical protein
MPLFQSKENLTENERKLKVLTFWLFVVSVFAWVIPFTLLFVVGLMNQALGQGGAFAVAFLPSLGTLAVTVVLCIIVYLVYRKTILKI